MDTTEKSLVQVGAAPLAAPSAAVAGLVAANDGGSVAGLRFAADDSTLIDLFEEIVLPDDLDLDFADSTGVGGEGH